MKPHWSRATFLAASFLLIGAARTQAQWTWLYPTPHGNNLNDVTFVNDLTAIAVGDAGTVMMSTDAGLTWKSLFRTNSFASKMNRIARIDDLTAVVVGNAGAILKSVDGGNTWTSKPRAGVSDLIDVSFSGATGIALGYGPYPTPNRMYRSTDGGETWTPVAGAPSPAYGVYMATPLIGYCIMDLLVLKTLDGGLTWAALPNAPYPHGGAHVPLAFSDAQNGVIGGGINSVYVTHDGGSSWTGQQIGTVFVEGGSSASDLEFRSTSSIAASVTETMCDVYTGGNCSTAGKAFRSSTSGSTWAYDSARRAVHGVAINSAGILLTVGDAGVIHRWSPPGTWQQLGGTTHWNALTDAGHLAFQSPNAGAFLGTSTRDVYAGPVTENVVMRTSTAGNSWTLSNWGGSNDSMKDIAYAPGTNDLYAIASPLSGPNVTTALLQSGDAGASWSTIWSSNQDFKLTTLEFSSATHGLAVGPGGYGAVINGAAASVVSIPVGIQSVIFADGSTAIGVGGTGSYPDFQARIIRSIDGGSTWTSVPTAVTKWLSDVAFASPSVGVAVGPDGFVLRSTDGGVSWSIVAVPTTDFLAAVAFSGSYGMAVGGYNGAVLETEDGGLTWANLAAPATGLLSDVAVFGPHHALVAGPELTVLEYRQNTVPTLFSSFDAVARELAAELHWSVQNQADLQAFRLVRDGATLATLSRGTRTYRDESVRPGTSYQYTLVAMDATGNETQSAPVRVTIPRASLQLLPNQPNPFNPETTIRFIVPEKTRVTLTVHDVAGRVVATLVDDVREPGMQTMAWNAQGLASGVYFAKLRAGKTEVSRKMVLLK